LEHDSWAEIAALIMTSNVTSFGDFNEGIQVKTNYGTINAAPAPGTLKIVQPLYILYDQVADRRPCLILKIPRKMSVFQPFYPPILVYPILRTT
jgi:hypothetical protein